MAVWCTYVGSNANQEVHHIVMPPTDGVMQASDALIIWLAGVSHLWKIFNTSKP